MRPFLIFACIVELIVFVSPSRAASDQPPDSTQVTPRPVAYDSLPPINSRLRVNAEIASPHFWDFVREKPFTGTLTAIHSDSLIIDSRVFHLASIKRIDVSQGKRHARREGTVLGMLVGGCGAVGLCTMANLISLTGGNDCSDPEGCPTNTFSDREIWQIAGVAAVAGAIAGAIFYKKEVWQEWTLTDSK